LCIFDPIQFFLIWVVEWLVVPLLKSVISGILWILDHPLTNIIISWMVELFVHVSDFISFLMNTVTQICKAIYDVSIFLATAIVNLTIQIFDALKEMSTFIVIKLLMFLLDWIFPVVLFIF